MKKLITLFALFAGLSIFLTGTTYAQGQWANNPPNHIYNLNAGNVGISNGAAWVPSEKLHINTLGASVAGIMAENSIAGNGAIGYFRIKNTASNYMFNMVLRKVGGNHEMIQSCYDASVPAWREYAYFNFATRKFEMRNGVMDAEYLNSGKFLISSLGNTGIGLANPLEKLDVNGAIRLGNTPNNNAGTIAWNGANFMGHNGAGWVALDVQNQPDNDWALLINPANGGLQLYPINPPNQVSLGPPGSPNFCGFLHVPDVVAPGLFPHLLGLESIHQGAFDASQLYRISNQHNPPFVDYSAGIFGMDGTYKVCFSPVLTPTFQGDGTTMLRANQNGIIDLPNQSRVRAYQVDPNGFNQMILPNLWTPVNFTMDTPPPQGYDEQNEFIVVPNANLPVPTEMSFFVASKEGYYQVNARVEFVPEYSQEGGPVAVNPMSYVSIAIYTGPGPGATVMYSQGNNLQIGMPAGPMFFNNAPNVSDVVYLMPGQIISIWVFQSAITPMDLMQGPNKTYVSIHKVS